MPTSSICYPSYLGLFALQFLDAICIKAVVFRFIFDAATFSMLLRMENFMFVVQE